MSDAHVMFGTSVLNTGATAKSHSIQVTGALPSRTLVHAIPPLVTGSLAVVPTCCGWHISINDQLGSISPADIA